MRKNLSPKKYQILNFLKDQLEIDKYLTVSTALDKLKEKFLNYSPSQRTINRHLNELESTHGEISSRISDGTKFYEIKKNSQPKGNANYFKDNYLISLKVLESQLKMFRNSKISKDIEKLITIIQNETGYKTSNFNSDSIYHNHVLGTYDYSDPKHGKIIDLILKVMEESKYVEVEYTSNIKKIIIGAFQEIYFYGGALYVAFFVKKHKHDISLAIQNIESIKIMEETHDLIFDFDDFTKTRFGVYEGEPERIVLEINPDYLKHFENRKFHNSQELIMENSQTILTLDVPITPELISWIVGWGEGLKVKSPERLKAEVISHLKNTLEFYK